MTFSSEEKQLQLVCFMVANSQDETHSTDYSTRQRISSLTALNGKVEDSKLKSGDVIEFLSCKTEPSHTVTQKRMAGNQNKGDGASPEGSTVTNHGETGERNASGAGDFSLQQGASSVSGGDGGNGNGPNINNIDLEEREAQPTSSSSGSSMPKLLTPSAADSVSTSPRIRGQQVEAANRERSSQMPPPHGPLQGILSCVDQLNQRQRSSSSHSESGGGYSDAPTAVVSDAEGHSELFPLSSSVMQADYGSGQSGSCNINLSHTEGGAISSSASTLSSYSTSSSGERTLFSRPPRKRPPPRKLAADERRTRAYISSTTDSTTPEQGTITSAGEVPHDKSHEQSTEPHSISSPEKSVPESTDDSSNIVPPSQDAYGTAPLTFTASPTEGVVPDSSSSNSSRCRSFDNEKKSTSSLLPSSSASSSVKSVFNNLQQWQPSIGSIEMLPYQTSSISSEDGLNVTVLETKKQQKVKGAGNQSPDSALTDLQMNSSSPSETVHNKVSGELPKTCQSKFSNLTKDMKQATKKDHLAVFTPASSQDMDLRFSQTEDDQSQYTFRIGSESVSHNISSRTRHTRSRLVPGFSQEIDSRDALDLTTNYGVKGTELENKEEITSGESTKSTRKETLGAPPLTLEMIDTQTQDTESSEVAFKLNHPANSLSMFERNVEKGEPPSIFKKARACKTRAQLQPHLSEESGETRTGSTNSDPFEFCENTDLKEQGKILKKLPDHKKLKSPKKNVKTKISLYDTESEAIKQVQENQKDSCVVINDDDATQEYDHPNLKKNKGKQSKTPYSPPATAGRITRGQYRLSVALDNEIIDSSACEMTETAQPMDSEPIVDLGVTVSPKRNKVTPGRPSKKDKNARKDHSALLSVQNSTQHATPVSCRQRSRQLQAASKLDEASSQPPELAPSTCLAVEDSDATTTPSDLQPPRLQSAVHFAPTSQSSPAPVLSHVPTLTSETAETLNMTDLGPRSAAKAGRYGRKPGKSRRSNSRLRKNSSVIMKPPVDESPTLTSQPSIPYSDQATAQKMAMGRDLHSIETTITKLQIMVTVTTVVEHLCGAVVNKRTNEKVEVISSATETNKEDMTPISPSRSVHTSFTSGDLGDISSITTSTGSSSRPGTMTSPNLYSKRSSSIVPSHTLGSAPKGRSKSRGSGLSREVCLLQKDIDVYPGPSHPTRRSSSINQPLLMYAEPPDIPIVTTDRPGFPRRSSSGTAPTTSSVADSSSLYSVPMPSEAEPNTEGRLLSSTMDKPSRHSATSPIKVDGKSHVLNNSPYETILPPSNSKFCKPVIPTNNSQTIEVDPPVTPIVDTSGFTLVSEKYIDTGRTSLNVLPKSVSTSADVVDINTKNSFKARGKSRGGRKGKSRQKKITANEPTENIEEIHLATMEQDKSDSASQKTKEIGVGVAVIGQVQEVSGEMNTSVASRKLSIPYLPEGSLLPGTSVLARWTDKHFYPGRVVITEPGGKHTVAFEDGDIKQVGHGQLVVCELLPIGQHVLAATQDGWSLPAIVTGHYFEEGEMGYCIVFEDGKPSRAGRGQISLNQKLVSKLLAAIRAGTLGNSETPIKDHEEKNDNLPVLQPAEAEEDDEVVTDLESPIVPVGPLAAGTQVFARWRNKHFYPGHVKAQLEAGRYIISFEDGDIYQVQDKDIIACEMLPVGQSVLAEHHSGWANPAIIMCHHRCVNSKNIRCTVEFEGGESRKVERGKVTLTPEQAAALLIMICGQGCAALASRADLSLENLVEGKRKRAISHSPASHQASPGRRKGGLAAAVLSCEEVPDTEDCPVNNTSRGRGKTKSRGGKRLLPQLEPQATSTPTPKRQRQITEEISHTSDETIPIPFPTTPIPESRSPKKSRVDLFTDLKGPIPKNDPNLFAGMLFLLTTVERSPEQRIRDRHLLKSREGADGTDESINADDDDVPYDKVHLEAQITAGKGTILDKFDMQSVESAKQCLLISDTFHRTIKYLHCLAAGIPCVSHIWVRDCCRSHITLDFHPYLLPAGVNIEKNRVVEWKPRGRVMQNMTALIASQDRNFQNNCAPVLATAGCTVLHEIPTDDKWKLDVVVSNHTINSEALEGATRHNTAVVSLEWVIQCLISGNVVQPDAHPKYRHDYVNM